jgi:predicted nicotinamide N-methyase
MATRWEGLDELLKKLDNIEQLKPIKAALRAAGVQIAGWLAEYPAVSRRKQAFKSEKQRKYFFAALKKGEIEVPYRRGMSWKSERLGQRWTMEEADDGNTVVVGNNASYARLTQDRDEQAAYHKATGWRTVQDAEETQVPVVLELAKYYVEEALK